MPAVKVRVKDGAPPCTLVFPRRVQLEGGGHSWAWDEVRVVDSAMDDAGFGLATRNTASLNWGALPSPVLLPFLGRQTEVGSPTEAGIMSRILHGSFDVVPFSQLNSEPGHRWVYNGIFLESVPHEGGAQHEVAKCAPDHSGEWRGEWEECTLLAEGAVTCDVRIASDGQCISAVPRRFVRECKPAVELPPDAPVVQAPRRAHRALRACRAHFATQPSSELELQP